ncbi:polymorphic toxin-type HINT domain-containing protein [Streptomyces achromogenes]|uniref:polymorphic toxin-type HINT domain-containing protein n=1 Tax=Streptomyces achromogenes TaxID=67255 RepID=UPI0033F1FBAD
MVVGEVDGAPGQTVQDLKDLVAGPGCSGVVAVGEAEEVGVAAEGQGIAATARKNSALAAQAAAEARNASGEADKAKQDAADSAKQAEGYAADADAAADRAETSAKEAKASATTARAAADRAAQDTAAAEESAAQAEFSADYAHTSAYQAAEARDRAQADALAAGKSAAEAEKVSAAAWRDVVEKREAEEAEARRLAAEKRKLEQEKERESKPKCYIPVNRDSLPPCAMAGQKLVFPTIDPQMKEFVWEILGLNDAKDCVKNPTLGKCSLAAMSALPIGKLKLLKKAVEGVEGAIDSSRAVRLAQKCAECFLAGTKVLMADRSVTSIEAVRVGDQVLATDPVTGETGARRVTALIVTEDDKYLSELSLSTPRGEEKLTATEEHPFWSPSADKWVEAFALQPGMTLRTDNGDTVTVRANRFLLKHARAYNLTVDGLHSYYVLAGDTPVLVHNSRCLIGNVVGPKGETLWLPKGRKAIATTDKGSGWVYEIKKSEAVANGLHERVAYVRVMDPVTKGPYQYPNGYVIYMNEGGQTMNPLTGQVGIPKSDPYNHIPIP